jgi:hypothetical protein
MRPAIFSTENPPHPIDDLDTKEYIAGLRRRIEVQQDGMEHLASQVHSLKAKIEHLTGEVEKLSLDLGIKNEEVPPGWKEVQR